MQQKRVITLLGSLLLFFGSTINGQISGPTLVNFGSTYQYTEPTVTGSPIDYTYFFKVIGGTLVSGQTQTSVSVIWNNAACGTVQKWKSSTHAYSIVLIQSLEVTVQNTPATEFLYDLAGNRIKKQVIILNPSTLKSGHIENSTDTIESKTEEENILTEQLDNLNIKIYPNPTYGSLKITLSGIDPTFTSSISVINLNGAIIKKISPISDSNEIDLSKNPDGVYVIVISANDKTSEWRVVKQ